MNVIVSDEIQRVCPDFVGACVEANVVNSQHSAALWDEIRQWSDKLKSELSVDTLKDIPG